MTSKRSFATQQKTEEKCGHGSGGPEQKAADTKGNQTRVANIQNRGLINTDEMLQMFKVLTQTSRMQRRGKLPIVYRNAQANGLYRRFVVIQVHKLYIIK